MPAYDLERVVLDDGGVDVPLFAAVVDAVGGRVAVERDVGVAQQGVDKRGRVEPCALLPI